MLQRWARVGGKGAKKQAAWTNEWAFRTHEMKNWACARTVRVYALFSLLKGSRERGQRCYALGWRVNKIAQYANATRTATEIDDGLQTRQTRQTRKNEKMGKYAQGMERCDKVKLDKFVNIVILVRFIVGIVVDHYSHNVRFIIICIIHLHHTLYDTKTLLKHFQSLPNIPISSHLSLEFSHRPTPPTCPSETKNCVD